MTLTRLRARLNKRPALKDILIRLAWLAVVLPSVVYSLASTQMTLSESTTEISRWVYGYLNFGSFIVGLIAAIIIFWRKSKDTLAVVVSLVLVTWTSTGSGYEFVVLTGIGGVEWNGFIAYLASIPYTLLLSALVLYVLLKFPDDKWTPLWGRWFFILALIWTLLTPVYLCLVFVMAVLGMMLENFLGSEQFLNMFFLIAPELFRDGVLVLGALMQIYRLITTRDPLQRQQIKWIVFTLVGMTFFYVVYNLAILFLTLDSDSAILITLFLILLLFTYGFIVAFVISVFRYRLWDMDIVINRALVYSGLTAILGSFGLASAVLFDYYAKEFLNQSSPVMALLILLPLVILFAPLKEALQNFVDRRFKPEEIDFSGTIVEFAPEAQLILTSQDILRILAQQVREQLNLTDVEIYLCHENGDLILSEPPQAEPAARVLSLVPEERAILEHGGALVPTDTSRYSLYLPLVLRRASRPEFLGALTLGKREGGVGYSSSVVRSLEKFGADAGKVFYIARLRESTGRNIIERLASIEKGLANLKTDVT